MIHSSSKHPIPVIACVPFSIIVLLGGVYLLAGCNPFGLTPAPPAPSLPTSTSTVLFSGANTLSPPTATLVLLPVIITDTPTPVAASATPVPHWWQVYFTAPTTINDPTRYAGSIEEALIQEIDSAQASIHIASFEFDLTPVAQALIAAQARGVDVRWVTDNDSGLGADTQPGHGQFAALTGAGIQVRSDDRTALMHDKFWIFDGQTVWTGSTNITVSGIFQQDNNVIVVHSPEVAAMYEREFSELWDGQFGPHSPSTVDLQTANVEGTNIQVLFAPEDHVLEKIAALVQGASNNVRFLAFSFTQDNLGEAMLGRAQAGADVRGVWETVGSDGTGSELPRLYCAHIPVREDGNPAFMHNKIIILDKRIVITGSLNFSASADESNDENVIILDNPDIANLYLQDFDNIWNQAHDPDPSKITCP